MTKQRLDDAQTELLVQTLVISHPDFDQFAREHVHLGEHLIPKNEAAILFRDLVAVLRESPEKAAEIDTLLRTPDRFEGGLVTIPVLLAITFLLRTHLQFKRHADGKWELQIEHKPADSKVLTQLLKKLATLLPGGMTNPLN